MIPRDTSTVPNNLQPPRTAGRTRRTLTGLMALLLLAVVALIVRSIRAGQDTPLLTSGTPEERVAFYERIVRESPARADSLVQLAQAYEDAGYWMSALDALDRARENGASRPSTSGAMGRCLLRLGRLDESQTELELAAESAPADARATADLAMLWKARGSPERASRTLRDFLKRSPNLTAKPGRESLESLLLLLAAADRASDSDTALTIADAILAVDPANLPARFARGRHLLRKDQVDEAVEALRTLVVDWPENAEARFAFGLALERRAGFEEQALVQWKEALRIAPDMAEVYPRIASLLLRKGRRAEAAKMYAAAAELREDPEANYARAARAWESAGRKAEALYCSAMAATEAEDYVAALSAWQELSLQPEPRWRKRGLGGIAEAYRRLGQNRKFLEAALRASANGTSEDDLRLSDAYLLLNDHGRRMKLLQSALKKDPSLAGRVQREIGAQAEREARWDDAERAYRAAIEAEPNRPTYHLALARLYLSRRQMGDRLNLALESSLRAAELAPQDPKAFHQLASVYTAAGRTDDAVKALEHAIDLDATRASAYLDLGQLLIRSGRKARGEKLLALYRQVTAAAIERDTLMKGVKRNPRRASAHAALGDYYAKTWDFASAEASYSRALRIDPRNSQVAARLSEARRAQGKRVSPDTASGHTVSLNAENYRP